MSSSGHRATNPSSSRSMIAVKRCCRCMIRVYNSWPVLLKERWRCRMGSISVACYKPRPGCEAALLELVRNHLPPLRAQGLVTERPSIVMRTADGIIIEVFEWVSQEAIAGAHSNPAVIDLWKRFEAVCTYETPSNIPEFQKMFSHFEPV